MNLEARQHVRYRLKKGMLAALPVHGTLKVIVGQILDISENGLALRHKDEISIGRKEAGLLLMGHEQSQAPAFEIPVTIVYEREQEEGYRSGFRFSDLSQGQMSRLTAFIRSNTESTAI